MRRLRYVCTVIAVLGFLSSLVASADEIEKQAMRQGMADYLKACKLNASQSLWHHDLCGRMLIADPETRFIVGSHQDKSGVLRPVGEVFEGQAPEGFTFSNTAVDFAGERWAEVMAPLPTETYLRIRLLIHESFHRVQPEIGLDGPSPLNDHLDEKDGRLWFRMELRALAQAVRSKDLPASRKAAIDAMSFRSYRNQLFPGSAKTEDELELHEGIPEYTGTVVALNVTGENMERLARETENFEQRTTYVRSAAYGTGPALGVLLDRYSPGWRNSLKTKSMAEMLSSALRLPRGESPEQLRHRAEAYAFKAVSFDEQQRSLVREQRMAEYRKLFITGPVLIFPETKELYRGFNPNNLVPFGEEGTVYPTGTFNAPWGSLEVSDGGALVAKNNMSLRVSAPKDISGNPVNGAGWVLKLHAGWTIQPIPSTGNYEVVKK